MNIRVQLYPSFRWVIFGEEDGSRQGCAAMDVVVNYAAIVVSLDEGMLEISSGPILVVDDNTGIRENC